MKSLENLVVWMDEFGETHQGTREDCRVWWAFPGSYVSHRNIGAKLFVVHIDEGNEIQSLCVEDRLRELRREVGDLSESYYKYEDPYYEEYQQEMPPQARENWRKSHTLCKEIHLLERMLTLNAADHRLSLAEFFSDEQFIDRKRPWTENKAKFVYYAIEEFKRDQALPPQRRQFSTDTDCLSYLWDGWSFEVVDKQWTKKKAMALLRQMR